jgi:hypothetical protein
MLSTGGADTALKMIAGNTVFRGSGDCFVPCNGAAPLRKIIKPAMLAPDASGILAKAFAIFGCGP